VQSLPELNASVGDGVMSESTLVLLCNDSVGALRRDIINVFNGDCLARVRAKKMSDRTSNLDEITIELARNVRAAPSFTSWLWRLPWATSPCIGLLHHHSLRRSHAVASHAAFDVAWPELGELGRHCQ
jgi:hypothetical protein